MAISYEPQQPFDASIYQAYGAAQARAADRDFALKAGAQAQQSAHQSSQLAQQDEHFAEQQRQQASLAQQQMAHQSAMQDSQHAAAFDLQQNRQNFEFTQADNLRLQRLNQDAAGWEQLRQTNEITPQEYQQGIDMLNRQQMPLQARRDAAQEQHTRRQNAQLAQQTAAITAMGTANAAFQARALPDSTVRHYDDSGNLIAITHPNGTGGFHTVNVPAQKPEAAAVSPQVMARFVIAAHTAQNNEIREAQRTGRQPPSWAPRDPSNPTPAETQALEANRQQRVNEMVRQQGGTGGATRADAAGQEAALSNLATGIVNRILPNVAPGGGAGAATGGAANAPVQRQIPGFEPGAADAYGIQ